MSTTGTSPPGSGTRRSVLVAGATGFLGRSVVRAFAKAGYEARGLVRDPAKQASVRADGGTPVPGDVLDLATLRPAAAGCSAIIQLAANPSDGGDSAMVRVEGTRNLAEAAQATGVGRLVVGSGYWVYPGQTAEINEDSTVEPRGESKINYDAEQAGLEAGGRWGLDVLVVRPGMVYGDGSWFRDLAESIRTGEYRVVGDGSNRWSFIDRWDAGEAFRSVVESGIAGQVYNAVDGHPASLREFADLVAAELGVPAPPSIPLKEAVSQWGETVARHLAADRATSAEKLMGIDWRPRVPTYREGVPALLRAIFPPGADAP